MLELSALLGRINQTARIGIWEAPLHYRSLQRLYISAFHKNGHFTTSQSFKIPLTKQASSELAWWSSNQLTQVNRLALTPPTIDMIISTDVIMSTPYSATNGQLHSGILHKQTRGDTITISSVPRHGGMELLPLTPDLGNSKTYPRSVQHRSRFRLEKPQQPHGMDPGQNDLPEDNTKVLHSNGGLVCVPHQQPASELCGTIPRSRVYHNGCFSAALEPVDSIHTCPNSANTTNPSETSAGPSNRTGDSSNLARTALVSDLTGVASRFSSTVTDDGVDNLTTLRSTSNPPNVENPPTGCTASVRFRLQTTGLSPEVCKILLTSWRTSTQKRYEGPRQLWASWCLQRNKCPFSAAVVDVLEFLSEQFNTRNLAYRTVGVYKTCISQLHDPVDGQQLGSLPLVSRFMKGIFQLRAPTPRICSTWRVGSVLRYLSSLEPLEELSLKVLSLKLITPLALTSAARAHEIAALDCNHVSKKIDAGNSLFPRTLKIRGRTTHRERYISDVTV